MRPVIDAIGPIGMIALLGVLGVMMVIGTLFAMVTRRPDPLDRLKKPVAVRAESLRQTGRNEQLEKFSKFLEPEDGAELSKIQQKLRRAGYQSPDAVRLFHFAQMALGLAGLGIGVFYVTMIAGGKGFTTQQLIMFTLGPGGIGYLAPKYWVTKRVQERQEQITAGFPDSLDMMLVCVEAGQSLDQAIARVATELRASCVPLADEYTIVSYELKAGKDRASVLHDMGDRCGVADLSSFVTVLIQSQQFGTSIGEALRVYASEMRDKRVMRAEEAANKLPTKMTLATMMLTVPPLLVILVGPSVHGITQLGSMGK